MYSKIETPLNVGVGLYLHQTTRSKKVIDMFSGLNLRISYEKVIDIKKDVANAILEKRDENNGVLIPSCLFPSQRPFFAIDNTDMKIDTPTGKRQLYETAMAAFQQHIHGKTHPIMQMQRKSKRRKADVLLYEDLTIPVPNKKHIENPNFLNMIAEDVLQQYRQPDLVWCPQKCLWNNSESKASNILNNFYLKV